MSTILGMGFEVTSTNGEFASVEEELGVLADIGTDYAEISLTSIDLIAGGRIIPERRERLKACTKSFDLKYTVHGLVSSNFMDPETCGYQLAAAKRWCNFAMISAPEYWFSMAAPSAAISWPSAATQTAGSAKP